MFSGKIYGGQNNHKKFGLLLQLVLLLVIVCVSTACGKKKSITTPAPNSQVTYEKGADLTGVIREVDTDGEMVAVYNPVTETEETFLYTSGTSIQSKNGTELVMDEVQPGEVYDLYVDDVGSGLTRMSAKADIVEEEDTQVYVDPDKQMLTVEGVNYAYSEFMVSLSDGKKIDPMEITAMDEVTFRGVSGKAFSLIVTKGHGYIEPIEYADFVGGTLTIEGESILPVTEGMLITVPEGAQTLSMKNGDLASSASATVERNKVAKLNMKEGMTQIPETARASFHINPEGAELYINGTMVDYSKPVPLYYGLHTIKVVLEGYNTYLGTIRVQDPEPSFRIDLAEEVATVEPSDDTSGESESNSSTVTDDDGTVQDPSDAEYDVDHKITVSAPNGASVYVNGTYKGVAPCSFTKCIGKITLTLQQEGYQTKSYSLEIIDDGEDTALSFPELAAAGQSD